jgi:Ca-activated chloride channel family protein
MSSGWTRSALPLLVLTLGGVAAAPAAAQTADASVFRSAVDYVSITAVVRDERGRTVPSLSREDFEVLDAGHPRPIVDLQAATTSPASVALLLDGSGSMRVGRAHDAAIAIAEAILDSLNPVRDDAALFTFDTRLITIEEFTRDLGVVRARLRQVEAFGSTSLFDAIGGTAGIVARRTQNRRAVVVLTDGLDNASVYGARDIGPIASAIDVPVYVFDLRATRAEPQPGHALADLARWTGGQYFAAGSPALVGESIRALLDELRHQYVIAFEAASAGGWRSVEVRTRKRGLRVRSRAGYMARLGE